MNNILVFYQSKYGATKLYMDMLKEKLDCDIVSTKNYIPGMEKDYEKILFSGGVYAGAISVMKFLRKNGENFKDKKTRRLCCGSKRAQRRRDQIFEKTKSCISSF